VSNSPFAQSSSHDFTASSSIAIVDFSALSHNLDQVRQRIPKHCDILAVVKADAYGHGATAVASALASRRWKKASNCATPAWQNRF
jgi:alanine racemase